MIMMLKQVQVFIYIQKDLLFADVYRLAGIINFVFGLFVISFLPSAEKKPQAKKRKDKKTVKKSYFNSNSIYIR